MTQNITAKHVALAKFLGCEADEVRATYGEKEFAFGREEYLVLTDEEADEAAEVAILDSVWAFKAEFLASFLGLPSEAAEMIQAFQEKKCEDANDTILSMIQPHGKTRFAEQAISADGRGHFLSGYDGEENQQGEYFI